MAGGSWGRSQEPWSAPQAHPALHIPHWSGCPSRLQPCGSRAWQALIRLSWPLVHQDAVLDILTETESLAHLLTTFEGRKLRPWQALLWVFPLTLLPTCRAPGPHTCNDSDVDLTRGHPRVVLCRQNRRARDEKGWLPTPCSVSNELVPSARRCTGPGCTGAWYMDRPLTGSPEQGPGSAWLLTIAGERCVNPRAVRHHYGISRTWGTPAASLSPLWPRALPVPAHKTPVQGVMTGPVVFSAASPAPSGLSFSCDDGKYRPCVGCLHMSVVGLAAVHLIYQVHDILGASQVVQWERVCLLMQEMNRRWTGDLIPGSGDPLQEEMATQSSILAWRMPWIRSLVGYSHGVAKSRTPLRDSTTAFISPFHRWATEAQRVMCPPSHSLSVFRLEAGT